MSELSVGACQCLSRKKVQDFFTLLRGGHTASQTLEKQAVNISAACLATYELEQPPSWLAFSQWLEKSRGMEICPGAANWANLLCTLVDILCLLGGSRLN